MATAQSHDIKQLHISVADISGNIICEDFQSDTSTLAGELQMHVATILKQPLCCVRLIYDERVLERKASFAELEVSDGALLSVAVLKKSVDEMTTEEVHEMFEEWIIWQLQSEHQIEELTRACITDELSFEQIYERLRQADWGDRLLAHFGISKMDFNKLPTMLKADPKGRALLSKHTE